MRGIKETGSGWGKLTQEVGPQQSTGDSLLPSTVRETKTRKKGSEGEETS